MPEKPGRKPNVPNLNRVIEFLLDGTYDGELGKLRDAIDQRNKSRRESVMELVHEVFGPQAGVQVNTDPERNPFIAKAVREKSESRQHRERLPGPYRVDPVDGKTLRAAAPPDADGYLEITNVFGDFHSRTLIDIWESWTPIESDGADVVSESDPLSHLDEVERDMEPPSDIERRGAIISGLHSSDIHD